MLYLLPFAFLEVPFVRKLCSLNPPRCVGCDKEEPNFCCGLHVSGPGFLAMGARFFASGNYSDFRPRFEFLKEPSTQKIIFSRSMKLDERIKKYKDTRV